jgi:3-deoxy-D-manno-octulosonate 8-phosphate phosphatase (KDO 8-P phosphatase)
MRHNLKKILEKASKIKAIFFDVDGVFTDGKLYFTNTGVEYKAFHSHDGLGIKMLIKAGIEVGIITARSSELVKRRMDELGVKHVFQNQEDKLHAFNILQERLAIPREYIAYVGDDLNDVAPIRQSGLGIAVANASPFVHVHADWSTTHHGGNGAVREICELILSAQNLLEPLCEQYL